MNKPRFIGGFPFQHLRAPKKRGTPTGTKPASVGGSKGMLRIHALTRVVLTSLAALLVLSVAASALVLVRGRTAGLSFPWPVTFSKIFASRSARTLNTPVGTNYVWSNNSGGDWQDPANWLPARTTPATTDRLLFNNGVSETITNVPTQTIGQLSVTVNTIATLQAAAPATLTIAGDAGDDLSVAAGSQLNINTATALTINLPTGTTGSISGSMTLSAGAHRLTAADATGITFQNGATFIEGTSFSGNPFGTTSLNSVIFASGSTFVYLAGSNPFAATQPSSVVVFQAGSTYSHHGSSVGLSTSGRTYANFELNVAGTATISGGAALVMDQLTVTQGTFNYEMTGTPGHAIKGDISVASGATLNFNPATAGTVNLSGSGSPQAIGGAGTLTFSSLSTIAIANAAGVNLGKDIATSGTFIVNSGGLLNCQTSVLSGSGTFTLASGGKLGIGDPNGITTAACGTGSTCGNVRTTARTNGR